MEGYLNKYINIVYRWKPRYFVLKNGILTYCDTKGESPKGTIHLKISEIELTPEDPLKIIINSGTKTLLLRANTIGDKIKWLNALRSSKEEIQKKDSEYNKLKANFNVSTLKDFFQKYEDQSQSSQNDSQASNMKYNDLSQLITSKINEIWAEQIRFDETLKSLIKRLGPNSSVSDLLNALETIGINLIVNFHFFFYFLQEENFNQFFYV